MAVDFREEFRRFMLILRAYWHHRGEEEIPRPVDVSDREAVIAARADRAYEEEFPPDKMFGTVGRVNRVSKLNVLTSLLANALIFGPIVCAVLLSIFSITGIIGNLMFYGECVGSISLVTLAMILPCLKIGFGGLIAGASMCQIDERLTKLICSRNARQELNDPICYLEEKNYLELEGEWRANDLIVEEYRRRISELKEQRDVLAGVCFDYEQIPGITPREIEEGLAKERASIKKLSSKIERLGNRIIRCNQRSQDIRKELEKVRAKIPLLVAGETMVRLENGELDREMAELDSVANRRITDARNAAGDMMEEVLISAGLTELEEVEEKKRRRELEGKRPKELPPPESEPKP